MFPEKQALPIVIDGKLLGPPKMDISATIGPELFAALTQHDNIQPIFIIDGIPFRSKTKMNFVIKEVQSKANAKFIFLTRGDVNLITESEFISNLSATTFEVCDVSFVEIAHFIQKNFSMSGSESEVVALRLRDIFKEFSLSAHPTYFAGIPRSTLSALLHANRRAELIQLAVDGFLSFVVADDTADVTLSRTTRFRFLRSLVIALRA